MPDMKPITTLKLVLERFAPYRLSILSNRISDIIAATYKDRFALSVTEWRIMAVLGEYPGVSGEEVSVKTQIEKSILSRAIQKLLKRHLVERSIDAQDRRRQVLTLSNLGLDIYRQVVPLSLQYEEKILACFNQKEQSQFSAYLDRLQEHVKSIV
jgi:DNA-binding MarR family transcriptional regulator